MPLVSITRLRLRSWRFLPFFAFHAIRSANQATKANGNFAVQFLRDGARTFWTSTVWTDESAMKAYMLSGAHRPAMRRLIEWCDEASVVHWTQESTEPPSWNEAYQRMQDEGRRSKVAHPSPAHVAFSIPEPAIGRSSVTKLR